jgi:hypothetical protein
MIAQSTSGIDFMVDIFWRVAPSGVLAKRALKKVLGGLFRVGWNRIFFEIILIFFNSWNSLIQILHEFSIAKIKIRRNISREDDRSIRSLNYLLSIAK